MAEKRPQLALEDKKSMVRPDEQEGKDKKHKRQALETQFNASETMDGSLDSTQEAPLEIKRDALIEEKGEKKFQEPKKKSLWDALENIKENAKKEGGENWKEEMKEEIVGFLKKLQGRKVYEYTNNGEIQYLRLQLKPGQRINKDSELVFDVLEVKDGRTQKVGEKTQQIQKIQYRDWKKNEPAEDETVSFKDKTGRFGNDERIVEKDNNNYVFKDKKTLNLVEKIAAGKVVKYEYEDENKNKKSAFAGSVEPRPKLTKREAGLKDKDEVELSQKQLQELSETPSDARIGKNKQKAQGFSQEIKDLAASDKTLEEIFEERAKAKELKDAKRSAGKLYEESQSGVAQPEPESKSANEQSEEKALLDKWLAVELKRFKQKERDEVREKCWDYILDDKIKRELCKKDKETGEVIYDKVTGQAIRDEDKFTDYLNNKIKEFAVPPSTGRTDFSSRTRFEIRSMPDPNTQKPNFNEEAFNMRILQGYRVDDIRRRGLWGRFRDWNSADWMVPGVIISRKTDDGLDHDFYSFKDLEAFKRKSQELAMKKEEERIKVLKEVFAKEKAGSVSASKKDNGVKNEGQEEMRLGWENELRELADRESELLGEIKGLDLAKENEGARKGLRKELGRIHELLNQISYEMKKDPTNWETIKVVIEKRIASLIRDIAEVKNKYSKIADGSKDENNKNKESKAEPGRQVPPSENLMPESAEKKQGEIKKEELLEGIKILGLSKDASPKEIDDKIYEYYNNRLNEKKPEYYKVALIFEKLRYPNGKGNGFIPEDERYQFIKDLLEK